LLWAPPTLYLPLVLTLIFETDPNYSCLLLASLKLYGAGSNSNQQLALGLVPSSWSIVPLPLADVVEISAGLDHCAAITKEGDLYTWGSNSSHQCLQPHNGQVVSKPTRVQAPEGLKFDRVVCVEPCGTIVITSTL